MPPFFTFLDGALAYECARCGQACCRGRGVALDAKRELVPLLARRPALSPLVAGLAPGLAGWADAADGCWFLEGDGLCAIERVDGRDAKPATCRLFPFNRVFHVGDVRVVDFNSVLCPLEEARPGEGVTYASLERDLAVVGDSPLVSSRVAPPRGGEGGWEALERGIVAASAGALEAAASTFVASQMAMTARGFGARVEEGALERETSARVSEWRTFLGLEVGDPLARRVGRGLALLTPSLRFNTLLRPNGPAWPEAVFRLPSLLLATGVLAEAAALAGRDSLRAITQVHQATGPLRELLARWDEPLVATTKPAVDAAAAFEAPLRRAVERLAAGRPAPLGQVLSETWRDEPPSVRGQCLSLLSRSGVTLAPASA